MATQDLNPEQTAALAALTDKQKTELWEGAWSAFRDQYEQYRSDNPGWQAFWTEHHESALDAAMKFVLPFLHQAYAPGEPVGAATEEAVRAKIAKENRGWDEAVDWLLNSRHTGDPEIQAAFWLLADGGCTREEAERGYMADDTPIIEARDDFEAAQAPVPATSPEATR